MVLAIGIRPNIELAKKAQLEVNRGVVVTDDMRTSDPDIFAVANASNIAAMCLAWFAPIWDQAKVCAARLAGDEGALFTSRALATSLKITGVDVFSAGALMAADASDDEITLRDDARGLYKKVVLRDGKLVGAVLYGDVADGHMVPANDAGQAGRQRLAGSDCVRPGFCRGRHSLRGRPRFFRHAGRYPDLRLQWRLQGRNCYRHPG